jgi:ubiquinone/menaquinone biosynthesis methyltransferase
VDVRNENEVIHFNTDSHFLSFLIMFIVRAGRCRHLSESLAVGVRRITTSSSRWGAAAGGVKTDFGFREVDKEKKEEMVREVFSKVARKYDIMNDLMSGGVHRLWKDEFVDMMGLQASASRYVTTPPESRRIPRLLDVAGGTGDISFRVAQQMFKFYGSDVTSICNSPAADEGSRQIVVCDINPEMLAVGKSRAPQVLGHTESNIVGFVEGNAEKLPFESNSFDFYTIAFGLRNVTDKNVSVVTIWRSNVSCLRNFLVRPLCEKRIVCCDQEDVLWYLNLVT